MNFLENCLILLAMPIGLLLAGYWLAARLVNVSAVERLAVATLAGLSALLWSVATINFFRPLSFTWACVGLWPMLLTLLIKSARGALALDLKAAVFTRRGAVVALALVTFLCLLLWPIFARPSLIFYDGTSNHDAFFWISAAEHLKRHTYMEDPVMSPLHPFTNSTPAIIGWRAAWGRMGAEGLLALTSSLVGLSPLKLYLCATATLILPWIAAVFLAVRTFVSERLGLVATLALVLLQPLFVFYYSNANLPNFIGALAAAGAVIATERALQAGPGRAAWCAFLALSVHALLCSYPEMLPFVVMPAGLLWLRPWFARGFAAAWRPAGVVVLAWLASLAINPASTVRAYQGFVASFVTARANQNWANLFEPLSYTQYIPGLATLAVTAVKNLGIAAGIVVTLALLFGFFHALRQAKDRWGILFTLAGAGALLAYTLYTGFNYGWQKTVQFGGAFWAAVIPVAIVQALAEKAAAGLPRAVWHRATLAVVAGFFGYATVVTCVDSHRWAERKDLTQDWFTLRDYAREHLRDAPVLIEGASFPMAFFHGMWATYFLADADLYFSARGQENGGYLREGVITESKGPIPAPQGYLVSREWADAFDADSPRHFTGDNVALLKKTNRVLNWEGLYPANGVPDIAEGRITLDVRPHSHSQLVLVLAPRKKESLLDHWRIVATADNQPSFRREIAGPPPWRLTIPLTANALNHLEIFADPPLDGTRSFPFAVRELKIIAAPE